MQAFLLLVHAIGFAFVAWWVMPRPDQNALTVFGTPEMVQFSSARYTDSAVRVNGLILGCAAKAVGQAFSCSKRFHDGIPARVTFFEMQTLEARMGLADAPKVLLRIEQNGEVVHDTSDHLLRGYFMTGLIIPFCVFAASFLLAVRKIKRTRQLRGERDAV